MDGDMLWHFFTLTFLSNGVCDSIQDHNITKYPIFGHISLLSDDLNGNQCGGGILGSGRTDLVAKVTALIHAVKLDVAASPELLDRYRHCVIAFTSDKGVESGIATAPTVDKDTAQKEVPLQATKK